MRTMHKAFHGYRVIQNAKGLWDAYTPVGNILYNDCKNSEEAWLLIDEYVNDYDYGCP